MNKLVLVIPAALLFSACNQAGPITGTTTQKAEKLAQIIESGGSADCTVTNFSEKSTTQMIISGKKMKIIGSDFGGGKKGTMINDTVYFYSWGEGDKDGFKTKLVTEKETKATEVVKQDEFDTEKAIQEFEDETKFKMDCARRNVSASEFVPPSDVKFTDLAELTKVVPSTPSVPTFKIPTVPNASDE